MALQKQARSSSGGGRGALSFFWGFLWVNSCSKIFCGHFFIFSLFLVFTPQLETVLTNTNNQIIGCSLHYHVRQAPKQERWGILPQIFPTNFSINVKKYCFGFCHDNFVKVWFIKNLNLFLFHIVFQTIPHSNCITHKSINIVFTLRTLERRSSGATSSNNTNKGEWRGGLHPS